MIHLRRSSSLLWSSTDQKVLSRSMVLFLGSRLAFGVVLGWVFVWFLRGCGVGVVSGGEKGNGGRFLVDVVDLGWGRYREKNGVNDGIDDFLTRGDCGIDLEVLKGMRGFGFSRNQSLGLCARRRDILGSVNERNQIDCQTPYFPTARLSLILTRFPNILFIGDETARNLHTTLNILLHQDLKLGSLSHSIMNDAEKSKCSCSTQYEAIKTCNKFQISDQNLKQKQPRTQTKNIYLPFPSPSNTPTTSPSTELELEPTSETLTIQTFKNLTSNTHNPWQPTPLILSFPSTFSREETVKGLEEWCKLVSEARRNIKVLYLPPPTVSAPSTSSSFAAAGLPRDGFGMGVGSGDGNGNANGERREERYQYEKEVAELAGRLKFEVLDFGGLDGGREGNGRGQVQDGERVMRRELERGMVFAGWLGFLESS